MSQQYYILDGKIRCIIDGDGSLPKGASACEAPTPKEYSDSDRAKQELAERAAIEARIK